MSEKEIDFENEYVSLKQNLDRYKNALNEQITNIIEGESIGLGFPIQSRTKEWNSISEKIDSKRFNVKRSVTELQDLVGLRIILLFKKDVIKMCDLIKEKFKIIKEYDTADKLKENEFGYTSYHFVISIPEEWTTVPSFSGFKDYRAEIQIRTLSQHTWSEASKELQYKQEQNVPKQLLRSINRVSALLETVDLEFERLLKERDEYRTFIKNSTPLSIENLNVDSLEKILDEMLPSENKDPKYKERYDEIIKELEYFGIKTSFDLTSLIKKHLNVAIEDDKRHAKSRVSFLAQKKKTPATDTELRAVKGLFFSHVGLVRTIMAKEDFKKYQESFNLRSVGKKISD